MAGLGSAGAKPQGSPAYDLMYSYDQYGNGTCVPGSGGGLCPAMSYNSTTNRLTSIGSTAIGYDAAGNQLNDIWSTYEYDAEGRVKHSSSSGQWQYPTYNALGQRVQDYQGTDPMTLSYPIDLFGQRTGTFAQWPSQNWTGRNVYWSQIAGQRLNMGGASAYIDHSDAVGSTTMETDPAGAVQWDVTHYPWGGVFQEQGVRQSEVVMGLDWEINDPLVPSATREVSPALGRWTTPDAFGGDVSNPQSLNRYAYVLDNPASLVDPLGLNGDCSWDVNTTITGTSGTLNCPIDGGWDVVSSSAGGCAPMYVNGGYVGSTCGTGTDNQGGRRNGGVSGGGSSASTGGPVPSYSQVLKSFNRCAANFADKYSVASLLHLNNSFIGNALLGSTTAAVSNLFLQSDPKVYVPAGTNLGAGANAGAAVKIGAIAAGKLPVGGTMYAYTGATVATQYGPALEMAPVGKTLADTALGSSSLGGVKALGGLLDIALPAQILYDEALYGVGEAACTAQAF